MIIILISTISFRRFSRMVQRRVLEITAERCAKVSHLQRKSDQIREKDSENHKCLMRKPYKIPGSKSHALLLNK